MRCRACELTRQDDPLVSTSVRLGCALAADEVTGDNVTGDNTTKAIAAHGSATGCTAIVHVPSIATDRADTTLALVCHHRVQATKGQAIAAAHGKRVGSLIGDVRLSWCSI